MKTWIVCVVAGMGMLSGAVSVAATPGLGAETTAAWSRDAGVTTAKDAGVNMGNEAPAMLAKDGGGWVLVSKDAGVSPMLAKDAGVTMLAREAGLEVSPP
ncbi:MAG: hypothetical protein ABSC94_18045 [Polyangiaceae bacterium]|jgi:hypothetical protein